MKKNILYAVIGVMINLCITTGFSQKDEKLLLTIDNDSIYLSEFLYIYKKNNPNPSYAYEDLKNYLDLFVNYKLIVKEAKDMGKDTLPAFVNEFKGYRKQLARPYLTDNEVTEQLIKEAYERMKTDVKARHILVRFPNSSPSPIDTLRAYKQIKAYENKIKKEGFDKVYNEIKNKNSKNVLAEDLGYFTAFRMVYPFESAAYNTPVGQTSSIVRTRFGYHILLVEDKRANKGSIQVAHIFIKSNNKDNAEQQKKAQEKIYKIYEELQNGGNFEALAKKYSEDRGSARKGGILPWFTTGQMVPEFEDAAFSLKENGDYSKPFQTSYGWHIVKRINYRPVPGYEEALPQIKKQIQKDSRSQVSKKRLLAKLKKEYHYQPYMQNVDQLIKVIDDSFYEGKWKPEKAAALHKPVFEIRDDNYCHCKAVFTQKDFADYLNTAQRRKHNKKGKELFYSLFEDFVNQKLIEFEDKNLENKYPEFKSLLQEYADGILLFELKDKNVWSKAMSDTAGLKAFYEKHKDNYLWPERAHIIIITCNNEKVCSKAEKLARKALAKNKDIAQYIGKLNKKETLVSIRDTLLTQENFYAWQPGMKWEKGSLKKEANTLFLMANIIPPTPKTLEEARGPVISDYQKYLEEQWLEELRKKHTIQIFDEALKNIKPQ